jgi:hypothetical protein
LQLARQPSGRSTPEIRPTGPQAKSTALADNAALLERLEALEREVAELKKLLGK